MKEHHVGLHWEIPGLRAVIESIPTPCRVCPFLHRKACFSQFPGYSRWKLDISPNKAARFSPGPTTQLLGCQPVPAAVDMSSWAPSLPPASFTLGSAKLGATWGVLLQFCGNYWVCFTEVSSVFKTPCTAMMLSVWGHLTQKWLGKWQPTNHYHQRHRE